MATCERCGQENPAAARFCNACGAALQAAAPREERKVVTVLFADLVGFTGRSERLDPEDVRAVLRDYHGVVRSLLESYGGTVEKFIGDAVMAVFGAPVAHEDDPERAVRAALAIRDAMTDSELDVRIGVNTGEALVALGALQAEGESMVAGDVVNTAARLQTAAPVGGVLAGEVTHRATKRVIEYRRADPVDAKGKTDSVAAWEAVVPRSRLGVDVVQTGATALVGRRRELGLVFDAFDRAREEREPQVVTLVGVPGIGKSRLVYELLRRVQESPELVYWRQGRSLPYGEGLPFWAVAEMVKAQAGILDTDDATAAAKKLDEAVATVVPDDAPTVAGRLRGLLGLDAAEAGEQAGAFAAWRSFFEGLADHRPLVLVFEDLHWADDGLLDFVEHLAGWMRGVPVLILATARPELLERRPAWGGGKLNTLTLALAPLSDEDTTRLLAAVLERAALPVELQSALLVQAGGNPLYAEQFARMVGERGGDELPENIQGIIAARLDALSSLEKDVLQSAAVVGKVFWPGAIGSADVEELLHGLERKEFVRRERRSTVAGETEYAFRHVLVRDVAYGQLPRAARSERHRAVAAWLEGLSDRSDDLVELVAYHHETALELARATGAESTELVDAARHALYRAGRKAVSLSALVAGARYLEAALEIWPDDDDRALLQFRCRRTRHFLTPKETEMAELEHIRDDLLAAGDVEHAAETELLMSVHTGLELGDRVQSRLLAEQALERLAPLRPTMAHARVHAALAGSAMMAGRLEATLRHGDEAIGVLEALGRRDDLAAQVRGNMGVARVNTGDTSGIEDLSAAVDELRRSRSSMLAWGLANTGASYGETLGDVRRAAALNDEALAAAEHFGLSGVSAWVGGQLSASLYWLGRWDEALELAAAYMDGRDSGSAYNEPFVRAFRARIMAGRGDTAGAAEELRLALATMSRSNDTQIVFPTLAVAARLGAGDAETALAAFREWGHGSAVYATVDLALAALDAGRTAEFLAIAAERPGAWRWQEAAVACASGNWAAAAVLFDEIGSLPDAAWARLQDGDVEAAGAFYRSVGAELPKPRAATA